MSHFFESGGQSIGVSASASILPMHIQDWFPLGWTAWISLWSSSVQFSRSVVSDSLRPHGLQHARPPCPSPSPGVCPTSCSLYRWCHLTISPTVVPFSSCPQSFPASVFSNESVLHIRWPKYWSFSFNISPSSEHPGLISFRMNWLDLLALQHHSSKASILWPSAFFIVQLSHSTWLLEKP